MQLQRRDEGAVNQLSANYANIIMPIDKGADELPKPKYASFWKLDMLLGVGDLFEMKLSAQNNSIVNLSERIPYISIPPVHTKMILYIWSYIINYKVVNKNSSSTEEGTSLICTPHLLLVFQKNTLFDQTTYDSYYYFYSHVCFSFAS